MPRYVPANSLESPRFTGVRTFMRLPFAQTTADVDFAVVGLPFDTGATWRVGTRFGPEAIRSMSAMLRPYHFAHDVNLFDHLSGVDYGDAAVVPGFIEHSYEKIEAFLQPLHEAGVTPVALGGDHSIVLAELRAAARKHGPLGLAQFDAHGDVWDQYFGHKYTHGTPIRRAMEEGLLDGSRVIQVGMRGPLYEPHDIQQARDFGFEVILADDARALGTAQVVEHIRRKVGGGAAFLSFDIDFFDPAYAPGTGTPEVGGFSGADGQQLLRGLTGINFVAFDVVEVLPAYDGPGQITALLGANMAWEMIALLAWRRKPHPRPLSSG
ncbi:MAG: agmatinase [Chloroflexi bacterium]|nr:agmatinase [Chloroflexota bacterium]